MTDAPEGKGPNEPVVPEAAAAVAEKAASGTKWYSPKNREFHLGEGAGKKALSIVGGVVGLGAVWVGLKNIGRGIGFVAPKKDEQGNDISAGIGTLILGAGELAAGAVITMNSVTRGKGAAVAR